MKTKIEKQVDALERVENRLLDACCTLNMNEIYRQISLANDARRNLNKPHLSMSHYDTIRNILTIVYKPSYTDESIVFYTNSTKIE